jgi:cytochrome P450
MIARSPKGQFLLGHLPDFASDLLGFLTKCAREQGDVVSLRLGWKPAVILNRPDLIEHIFVTQNQNFIKHSFFWRHVTAIFGNGLITSEGDFWLRQRRLAQPAFHRQRISGYGDVMVAYAGVMLDRWQDGETRDIHHEMMQLTSKIVAKTLFNAELPGDLDEFDSSFNIAINEISARFRRPFRIPDSIPTPGNLRYCNSVRRINQLIYGIIHQRRQNGEDQGDLLSMLLQAQDEDGSQMSDQQLRDEAVTLFLAGHETTALVLSWTWYLLSQHPDLEAKLHGELKRVLGDRTPNVNDLPQLVYTERIIMESMRLYPPAYVIGREAVRDCKIDGYDIPAHTTVFVSPWVVHHDERYFRNPEQFDPDRWANDFAKKLPRFAYFPFGGGPRLCIGNSFAIMEANLLLATIAQRFRLELVPEHPVVLHPSITLRPLYGMRMILKEQKR